LEDLKYGVAPNLPVRKGDSIIAGNSQQNNGNDSSLVLNYCYWKRILSPIPIEVNRVLQKALNRKTYCQVSLGYISHQYNK